MREIRAVESGADCPDHAVHHSAGSDDVGSGLRVAYRLPCQQLQRGIVVDVHSPNLLIEHAALPVIGVLAETNVGDD